VLSQFAQHDRAMSLHHRAYDLWESGDAGYSLFCSLLATLADRDNDPELRKECTTQQIWNTAGEARRAGMEKRVAFPLMGDLLGAQGSLL
jgi:hypothetical protein